MMIIIRSILEKIIGSVVDTMTFLFELLSAGFDYIFDIALDILMA